MSSRSFVRGTFIFMVGGFVAQAISAVTGLLIARTIGLEGYGQYAAALALAGAFMRFFLMGLDGIIPREIARRPAAAAQILPSALLPVAGWALGLAGLIIGLGVLLGYSATAMRVLLVVAPLTAARALLLLLRSAWRGAERLDLDAYNQMVEGVAGLLGALVALQVARSALGASVGMLVAELLVIGASGWLLMRGFSGYRFERRLSGELVRAALPLGVTFAMLEFNTRLEALALAFFRAEREVGLYSAALGVAMMFSALGFLSTALLPRLSALAGRDEGQFSAFWERGYRYVVFIGMAAGVSAAALAPTLIGLLYGPDFVAGAPALRLLGLMIVILFVNRYVWNVLIALDMQAAIARSVALAFGATLVFGLLLVPIFGIVGAALAAVLREVCQMAALSYVVSRRAPVLRVLRGLWPALLAGLALGAVLMAAGTQPMLVTLALAPLGLALYAAVLLATHAIPPGDLQILLSAAGRPPATINRSQVTLEQAEH